MWLTRLINSQDRNAFVIALIDGDGTVFTKDLLSKGEKGGKEAATLLQNSLTDFATTNLPHLEDVKIVAKIYANTSSLADKLVAGKMIDKPSILTDFVRGFNSTKLLFDFVDAGTRKEVAGDKLSEALRLHLYDCHCHAVLLGCSHDNDYARILEEVVADSEIAEHLTLLEGVPFEKDIAAIEDQFKTIKFENLFRCSKLVPVNATPKPPPGLTLPALAKVESNKASTPNSAASTPQMNWATVTAQAHTNPANGITGSSGPPSVTSKSATSQRASTPTPLTPTDLPRSKATTKVIERNRLGQRIDKTDTTIPNYEIQRVKKLKLCNTYYLQTSQQCTSSHCTHRHDYPISNYERKVLREVARMTPCYYKTDCDDPDCIYGHRCPQSKPNEQGCYYGDDCRFYGWGHAIDTRICKTTRV